MICFFIACRPGIIRGGFSFVPKYEKSAPTICERTYFLLVCQTGFLDTFNEVSL